MRVNCFLQPINPENYMLKFWTFGRVIMKNIYQSVKGTREFYPEEMGLA